MPISIHNSRLTPAPTPGARRFQCRHIFTDGHRCGSPCLRNEDFCFYHHQSRGRAALAPTQTIDYSQGEHRAASFPIPVPEDRSAIQHGIGEILNRLAQNELDPRRAGLLLYGLQIASLNLPRATPIAPAMVDEVVSDPSFGTLAPRTELIDPAAEKASTSLIGRLLDELHRGRPTPEGGPDPAATPSPAPHPALPPPGFVVP